MKFTIEKVGPVKRATIEMGSLTIVCGRNNTGKTFLTRTIYEFYKLFRSNLTFSVDIAQGTFPVDIDLSRYASKAAVAVRECAKKFSSVILRKGSLKVQIKPEEFPVCCSAPSSTWKIDNLHLRVEKRGSILHIEEIQSPIQTENEGQHDPTESQPKFGEIISAIVKNYLFSQRCNDCFVSDSFSIMSEREGLVHFKTHINIANAFISSQRREDDQDVKLEPEDKEKLSDRRLLPLSLSLIHALSIFERENSLSNMKQTSFQSQFNEELDALVEGKYHIDKGEFFFTPDDAKDVRLSMDQSSSSVESLLLLDYYVRYFSEKGDVLVIDEPELNLHPVKQRQLARFLGTLVNAGIKVFLTTHSDYIIREFNTMILLHQADSRITAIRKKNKYTESQTLDAKFIKAYISQKKEGEVTFRNIPVDQRKGMVIQTLDEVINDMNSIQDEIFWGDY